MEKLRLFLAGKKTYLLAAAGAITSIVAWSAGEVTLMQALIGMFGSLGLGTLRSGVKKESGK